MMNVFRATIKKINSLAELALLLWPHHTEADIDADFAEIIKRKDAVLFLAEEDDIAIGFAHCQLRHDYVEGTESSPVGYLEGIFVREEYRNQGVARGLLAACEDWAREQGCTEFASDCELTNTMSFQFHLSVGFEEASRNIHFYKRI